MLAPLEIPTSTRRAAAGLFALLLPSLALAVDTDQDGYHRDAFPNDCNDANSGIHPDRAEVIGDGIDQDCDHQDSLRRKIISSKFTTPAWGYSGSVTFSGDQVTVGGQGAGSAWRSFNRPDPNGKVILTAEVQSKTGQADCTISVTTVPWNGGAPQTANISVHTAGRIITNPLAVHAAPRNIANVSLTCPAGSVMTLDWFQLQNAPLFFAPAPDAVLSWKDVEAPGGGLAWSNTRAYREWITTSGFPISGFMSQDTVYTVSDVGGVARKSAFTEKWKTINGSGEGTSLDNQARLAVWDILPSVHDALYILTGREYSGTGEFYGGLMESTDGGTTWDLLFDSENDDVAGRGRYNPLTGDDVTYAGGRLLAEESGSEILYFANGDPDVTGARVWIRDASGSVCELPQETTGELPTDGWVRAIERTYSFDTGLPVLLVGLQARNGSDPSVYACQLHADETTECGTTDHLAMCTEVSGTEGMDVRDIEIDPLSVCEFAVADSSYDSSASPYDGDTDDIWVGSLTDDGTDVTATLHTDLLADFNIDADDETLTGIAFDDDGDYLFAFVPRTHDGDYASDRIWRIARTDFGDASAWEAVNTDDGDESARAANVYGSQSWLTGPNDTADIVGKTLPYPARWAPGAAIDGVWVPYNPILGGDWTSVAYISTTYNLWSAFGLDEPGSVPWDPENETTWTFDPEPSSSNDRTFQGSVTNDLEVDGQGNVWMPSADLGLLLWPAAVAGTYDDPFSQLDCIWDEYQSGGIAVSVGTDDSVWVAAYDQSVSSTSPPQELGVFRTLDYGETWEYEGAGYDAAYRSVTSGQASATCQDFRVDSILDRPVPPFGATTGAAFNDDSDDLTDPSWGNIAAISALDQNTAVVLFKSYTYSSVEYPGRIGYTVDGGLSWSSVTFDGDWNENGADANDCVEYDTLYTASGLDLVEVDSIGALTVVGAASNAAGRLQGTDQIVVYLASKQSGSPGSTDNECGLARVEITAGSGADAYDWDWIQIVRAWTATSCRVDENNIAGVVSSPFPPASSTGTTHVEEVFDWAELEYSLGHTAFVGGACAITRSETSSGTVSYATTQLVSPDTYPASVGDVAPSPFVTDSVLVALSGNLQALKNYTASVPGDPLGLPNAWPLLVDRTGSSWTPTELNSDDTLPNLVGTAAGWGMDRDGGGEVDIYLGTEGSGSWWTVYDDGDTGAP